MRNFFLRTRQAVVSNHSVRKAIWRIRNAWVEKGNGERGIFPPGAHCQQAKGKTYTKRPLEPGHGGRRPLAQTDTCSINAIVHDQNGKQYVGHTIENPYVRFLEHMSTADVLGRAIKSDHSRFVVVLLDVTPRLLDGVASAGTQQHRRRREKFVDTPFKGTYAWIQYP